MALVQPTFMHRLGLVVDDPVAASRWFQHVLGSVPVAGTRRPFQETPLPTDTAREGTAATLLWHGGIPMILLGAPGRVGPIGRFLDRWGPGLHSLAWEVADMWTTEHLLRQNDLRITGVDVPGRHFFMHPRDTDGMLIEWTDTAIVGDSRHGDNQPAESLGLVGQPLSIAWVVAVVADADRSAQHLRDLAGADDVEGLPVSDDLDERVVDVRVGDCTIRLVTPLHAGSRYWSPLAQGPRFWSYAIGVADLDGALAALSAAGVRVVDRDGTRAWTDPGTTHGIPIEWTAVT